MGFIVCMTFTGSVTADEPVEPATCQISGGAGLITSNYTTGDFSMGDLTGSANSGTGTWVHTTATESWTLVPENVTCRLNGIAIGNSVGTIAGDSSLSYILHIEDQPPQLQLFTIDIVASRTPSRGGVVWSDGVLEDQVLLTIPDDIPVVNGSAGNQWAALSFTQSADGSETTCRYRGTADTPLEPSDRYVLDACSGPGRLIVGADVIEVERIELHLQGSAPRVSTIVSVPARIRRSVSDFLIFVVIDVATGNDVHTSYGYVYEESDDFVVESLD